MGFRTATCCSAARGLHLYVGQAGCPLGLPRRLLVLLQAGAAPRGHAKVRGEWEGEWEVREGKRERAIVYIPQGRAV